MIADQWLIPLDVLTARTLASRIVWTSAQREALHDTTDCHLEADWEAATLDVARAHEADLDRCPDSDGVDRPTWRDPALTAGYWRVLARPTAHEVNLEAFARAGRRGRPAIFAGACPADPDGIHHIGCGC